MSSTAPNRAESFSSTNVPLPNQSCPHLMGLFVDALQVSKEHPQQLSHGRAGTTVQIMFGFEHEIRWSATKQPLQLAAAGALVLPPKRRC